MTDPDCRQALYLSPHFDDAALSCGGSIRRRVEAGEAVLVLTICAAGPAAPDRLSPLARALHARWQAGRLPEGGPQPYSVDWRRQEDVLAMAALGAQALWWDLPDAIYREEGGRWAYATERALFAAPTPSDARLAASLASRLADLDGVGRETAVFAPLAVGRHVDHQLVRRAAELWRADGGVWLYEDFPYAGAPGALRAALGRRSRWIQRRIRLAPHHLQAKVAAIACYASQVGSFWPGAREMAAAVRAQAVRTGNGRPAERCWRRSGRR